VNAEWTLPEFIAAASARINMLPPAVIVFGAEGKSALLL
jgi:hypothetical protein